jgi:hypothetical protein
MISCGLFSFLKMLLTMRICLRKLWLALAFISLSGGCRSEEIVVMKKKSDIIPFQSGDHSKYSYLVFFLAVLIVLLNNYLHYVFCSE